MSTTHLTPSRCWSCGYEIDAATGVVVEGSPKPGDVSICLMCAALGVYVDGPAGLVVRQPTEAETEQMHRDPNITRYLLAHREAAPRIGLRPGGI